ncbi:ATP-dependent DNA ligase [Pampinifervens florentissimum]|uniref:ATP-dependent DNA ligase n=1 Tax=Pampinifervens florentissimum TaxID=1632019 RepID=UPI0013B49E70|nr:ATP-dependent DNA ligase [Hydrogenobacter sp. T-8]QID32377.1 ATP-dependent DNA ligase [Hydrogenobacter sp. T-8]
MTFRELSEYFYRLEQITSRLEMADILRDLLERAKAEEIDKVVYLTLGELMPAFRGVEFGVSEKLMMEALSKASGVKVKQVEALYKQKGDLGETAQGIISWQGRGLSLVRVYEELLDVARTRGTLDKVMKLINLLKGLSGFEAKYAVRVIIGRLRLGVGDATIIDALSLTMGDKELKPYIERAYNLCSDLGLVAKRLKEGGLDAIREFKIQVGYPIRMALAERVSSAEEIIQRLRRCAIEAKYDGFRLQVHKDGSKVEIYSRNLEPMTEMFPDVVKAVIGDIKAQSVILEGEALAVNEETGEFYPFQVTIQRKRKYSVEEYAKEYPLRLFVFDLLYLEGEDYTVKPYIERRRALEELLTHTNTLRASEMFITDSVKEVEAFFEDAITRGLEGIMAKRLDAPYTAGSRNFNWIKLKRSYRGSLADTIDVVIVGYYYGRGARAKLGIGGILVAVYEPSTDTFKTISKVGSGFTEEEWVRLKEMLDKIRLDHRHPRVDSLMDVDVWVEPRYVITVNADEITRSPLHTAGRTLEEPGYALRFPRAVSFIREDKNPEDANTVEEIIRLYQLQKRVSVE